MKRIWNVRLNVDEWNYGIAGLDDDADRIRFLAGFNAGLNGKETMPKGQAWEAGWKVGNSSHLEAIKFGQLQRDRALKRDYGNATAMPRHESGCAAAMPNDNLQSTIGVTTNDHPTNRQSSEKRERFTPPTLEQVRAYCQERGRGVDAERWVNHYESKGWLVGKSKMKNWQAAVRTWEDPLPAQPAPRQAAPPPNLDFT
jgi:hypothetical protein